MHIDSIKSVAESGEFYLLVEEGDNFVFGVYDTYEEALTDCMNEQISRALSKLY